ncbi:MAG: hypothetical protein JJ921_11315 [Pseudomonadales bacterium]|nr:hypothetical protein [Pseudomonadales bacterium]MBO6702923.1 hypothetical protein [Pseudomonadales bacterium]MBO6822792.1 hypothetical protein [Pseudomonadales bacterium]MBO7007241.1 hypothetical protein [Pseudomonadales bacterium]
MAVNLLAHSLALFSVLISRLYSPEVAALVALLIVVSGFRQRRFFVSRRVRLSGDQWFVDDAGTAEHLLSPMFTGKWFIVLRLSVSGFVVIGRDSVSRSEFRRLTVLLRTRASRMTAV